MCVEIDRRLSMTSAISRGLCCGFLRRLLLVGFRRSRIFYGTSSLSLRAAYHSPRSSLLEPHVVERQGRGGDL